MDSDRRWNNENVMYICTAVACVLIAAIIAGLIAYAVTKGQEVDPTATQRIELKQSVLDTCNTEENTSVRALCVAVVNGQNEGR